MQTYFQFQGQVQGRQRALGQILRVKDDHVVSEHIQVIQQHNQVALALAAVILGDEARLLKGPRWAGEPDILGALGQGIVKVPGVVTQAVEQPTRRRSALGKVVRSCGIDSDLPEMLILLGHPAVVDAAELAVGRPHEGGCDSGVGGSVGVEDPACGGRAQLVTGCHLAFGQGIRGPPEEYVAIGDGEIDDDVAVVVLEAACNMPLESCGRAVISPWTPQVCLDMSRGWDTHHYQP